MSLYQVITNEALDEDRKANREVLLRLKKHYTDNKENIEPSLTLDSIQRNVLKKNLSTFERQLYKLIGYVEERRLNNKAFNIEELTNFISNIILSYNNLVIFIEQLNYSKLFQSDKTYIDNKMLEYLPIIKLIENSIKNSVDNSLLSPISAIKSNIEMKLYNPIGYGIKEILEETPKREKLAKQRVLKSNLQDINTKSKIKALAPQTAINLVKKLSGIKVSTKSQALPILYKKLDEYNDIIKREIAEQRPIEREEEQRPIDEDEEEDDEEEDDEE